jgi:hypothetical protein
VPEVLEVHDNAVTPIRRDARDAHRLSISAEGEGAFDEKTLMARLAAMPGKERIRAIYVAPRSSVTHCGFLKHFVNVTALTLASTRMTSTVGLRSAPQLSDLILGTDQPNRVDLAELPGSSVSRVRVERPRSADLQAVGQCIRIRRLEVVTAANVDFRVFAGMQLDALTLINVRNEEVRALDPSGDIDMLWLSHCVSLTRFAGANTRVRRLWVDACDQLDFESLTSLRRLTMLRITKCRQPFDLGLLARLPELEEISFANCKLVLLDGAEKVHAPILRKLWAGSVKDDVVNRISRALPSTLVCNGSVLEMGGVRQRDVQAFHNT